VSPKVPGWARCSASSCGFSSWPTPNPPRA
jgi:hypothetical protein